ncbi:discoidin domain-containing protein [Cytobacillus sp. Hm23]
MVDFNFNDPTEYDFPHPLSVEGGRLILSKAEGAYELDTDYITTLGSPEGKVEGRNIQRLEVIETKPSSTNIKYLVSFDGGQTWEINKPDGSNNPSLLSRALPLRMQANQSEKLVSSASSTFVSTADFSAYKAFNGTNIDASDCWITYIHRTSGWLQIDLSEELIVSQYSITSRNASNGAETAPRDWTVQGSVDGVSFDILHTVTEEADWDSNEKRLFTILTPSDKKYRYYRLDIYSNNGDPSYTAVGEFELFPLPLITPNWETVDLDSIGSSGMNKSSLESISVEDWAQKGLYNDVRIAVALASSIEDVTPSLSKVSIVTGLGGVKEGTFDYGVRKINEGGLYYTLLASGSTIPLSLNGKEGNYTKGTRGVRDSGMSNVLALSGSITPYISPGLVSHSYSTGTRDSMIVQGNSVVSPLIGFVRHNGGTSYKVHEGNHLSGDLRGSLQITQEGHFESVIHFGDSSYGSTPVNKTHFGIKYGVGYVELPPFKPRISPSNWHPAIYNGQKKNDQPLNE